MSNYMCEQVYTLKTSLRDLVLLKKKKAQRVVHKSGATEGVSSLGRHGGQKGKTLKIPQGPSEL